MKEKGLKVSFIKENFEPTKSSKESKAGKRITLAETGLSASKESIVRSTISELESKKLKEEHNSGTSKKQNSEEASFSTLKGIAADSENYEKLINEDIYELIQSLKETGLAKLEGEKKKRIDDISKSCGIPSLYLLFIASFCQDNNCIIIIRPVNKYTAKRMIEENAVGKPLEVKGKTSAFPILGGYITFEVTLSKQNKNRKLEEESKLPLKLELQQKNANLIKESEEKFKSLSTKASDLSQFLQRGGKLFTTTEVEIDYKEKKYPLFFLKNKQGNPVWHENPFRHKDRLRHEDRPILLIEVGRSTLELKNQDNQKKHYEFKEYHGGRGTHKKEKVKVISLRQFSFEADEQNNIISFKEQTPRKITADLDILLFGINKDDSILPFNGEGKIIIENSEEIQEISKSEIEEILNKIKELEQIKNRTENQQEEYDQYLKKQDQLIKNIVQYHKNEFGRMFEYKKNPTLGNVTSMHEAEIIYLRQALNEAIRHGAETGNPYPERIEKHGIFTAFIHEGKLSILKGQDKLINFIQTINEKDGIYFDLPKKSAFSYSQDGKILFQSHNLDYRSIEKEVESREDEKKCYDKYLEVKKLKCLPPLKYQIQNKNDEINTFIRNICDSFNSSQLEDLKKFEEDYKELVKEFEIEHSRPPLIEKKINEINKGKGKKREEDEVSKKVEEERPKSTVGEPYSYSRKTEIRSR